MINIKIKKVKWYRSFTYELTLYGGKILSLTNPNYKEYQEMKIYNERFGIENRNYDVTIDKNIIFEIGDRIKLDDSFYGIPFFNSQDGTIIDKNNEFFIVKLDDYEKPIPIQKTDIKWIYNKERKGKLCQ